jgi:hypothetical protein
MTHYTKRILRDLVLLALLAGVCYSFVLIAQKLENKPKNSPKANLTTIYNFNPKNNQK